MADDGGKNNGPDDGTKGKNDDEQLGEAGMNALRQERARANQAEKDRDDFKKRLEALEAANLSKEEAAIKRAEAAEARAKQLEEADSLRKLRAEVAGEDRDLVDLLTGTTKEELEASKAKLESYLGRSKKDGLKNHVVGNTDPDDSDDSERDALSILGFGES
ncbi:scaffolding protein [Gordonia phage GiKK]|nr:scaffolding protein [Gordonia phage GiKK]UVK63902.1 scaffolding protein [Gordonia phage Button]